MLTHITQFYRRHNLRPFQCTWLLYVHLLSVVGLVYSLCYPELLGKIALIHCVIHFFYGLGITAGCHRLWAHKSYQASLPLRIFLMLLNSGANQGSIFHWSRDHRLHHKFSDTDLDPHTIKRGFFFSHIGWLLINKSPELVAEGHKIDMSDLKSDKVVMFQKKHILVLSLFMCFVVPTVIYHLAGIPILHSFLLSMVSYCLILNATWCVNSVCHMFGSRPWNSKIEPTDNYFVSLITNGEGYHNWHHEYPSDWKGSKDQWYMINLTTRFLEVASMLRLCILKP